MKKIKITESQLQKLTEAESDVMGYIQSLQKQINELKSQINGVGGKIEVIIPEGAIKTTITGMAGQIPVTGTAINQTPVKGYGVNKSPSNTPK